jgi:hypothetical protein
MASTSSRGNLPIQPTPVEAAATISAATGLDVRYHRMDRTDAELIRQQTGPSVRRI